MRTPSKLREAPGQVHQTPTVTEPLNVFTNGHAAKNRAVLAYVNADHANRLGLVDEKQGEVPGCVFVGVTLVV